MPNSSNPRQGSVPIGINRNRDSLPDHNMGSINILVSNNITIWRLACDQAMRDVLRNTRVVMEWTELLQIYEFNYLQMAVCPTGAYGCTRDSAGFGSIKYISRGRCVCHGGVTLGYGLWYNSRKVYKLICQVWFCVILNHDTITPKSGTKWNSWLNNHTEIGHEMKFLIEQY